MPATDCWSMTPPLRPYERVPLGDMVPLMRAALLGLTEEAFLVAALNDVDQVMELVEVGRGSPFYVTVSLPDILAVPRMARCKRVALSHNHPSGLLGPSLLDRLLTDTARSGLEEIGVTLVDHLIFGPDGDYASTLLAEA